MLNYDLLDFDLDMYASHQLKYTQGMPEWNYAAKNTSATTAVGGKSGYSLKNGAYADKITPENSYINYKGMDGAVDIRFIPARGINRGDWNPGGRALVTVYNWKFAKIQADGGLDKNKISIGARGVIETPKKIGGIKMPFTYEINAGIRLNITPHDNYGFKWAE